MTTGYTEKKMKSTPSCDMKRWLPHILLLKKEYIVSDITKYTFVIFSTSWCAPCHKLISLLKELYSKKNTVIEFIYISIDEDNRKKNWKELMVKEQIPWRSLRWWNNWHYANDCTDYYYDIFRFHIFHFFLKYPIYRLFRWNLFPFQETAVKDISGKYIGNSCPLMITSARERYHPSWLHVL